MTRVASRLRIVMVCVGGVGALALFACGPSESPSAAGKAVGQEANDLGDAARTGAAAETVKAIGEWGDEVQAQVNEKGLGKTIEDAATDAADRVEQSGEVFKEAYEKARAEGEGRLDAASEGYNAVDQHHVPVDEKPQTR